MSNFGILKKLDDLCKLPKTTDTHLVENFNSDFSRNHYYQASKRNDLNFTINHYAGKVTYNAENFLEKNRDSLPYRVAELLRNSSNEILSEIFTTITMTNQLGTGRKESTVFSTYNIVR
jgi:myosin heavy subunit